MVNDDNGLVVYVKAAVGDKAFGAYHGLEAAVSKAGNAFVHVDEVLVKFDHFEVFVPPREGSAVVGIRPADYSCFISVVDGGRAGPCHLNDHACAEAAVSEAPACRIGTAGREAADGGVGAG